MSFVMADESGGSFDLQTIQRAHRPRQSVPLGQDPALFGPSGLPQRGNGIQPSGCEERATLGTWTNTTSNPNGVVAIVYGA